MGIGKRNDAAAVGVRHAPIHGGIARKACFERRNCWRQLTEALLQESRNRTWSRKSAYHGVQAWAGTIMLRGSISRIAAVSSRACRGNERTTIPSELCSNALQEPADLLDGIKARNVHKQMHAAALARMFEDAGEFGTEDEVGVLVGKEVTRSGLQSLL